MQESKPPSASCWDRLFYEEWRLDWKSQRCFSNSWSSSKKYSLEMLGPRDEEGRVAGRLNKGPIFPEWKGHFSSMGLQILNALIRHKIIRWTTWVFVKERLKVSTHLPYSFTFHTWIHIIPPPDSKMPFAWSPLSNTLFCWYCQRERELLERRDAGTNQKTEKERRRCCYCCWSS